MIFKINVDSFEFTVEITYYSKGYPAKIWALPEDCYEERPEEIEFTVFSVTETDEDGKEIVVDNSVAEDYLELIEEKLLIEIHEMQEEGYYD